MTGNGYIEIELNGKPLGLRFNMYAIEQFETVKGNSSYSKNLTTIVYAGLLGNAFALQKEPEISFADINEWVEQQILNEDPDGALNAAAEAFINSNAYKGLTRAKSNGQPDDAKKKEIVSL